MPTRVIHKARKHRRAGKPARTTSTFPLPGLFTKDAATIARVAATPRVSPGGLGAALRMVQYVLNRGGKELSASRRRELEKAKILLRKRAASARRREKLSTSALGTGRATRKQPPAGRRSEHEALESRREQSRHERQERDRLDALERSALAERSLRPRIAARANTESRRSGRRTVTTRAGRRTRDR